MTTVAHAESTWEQVGNRHAPWWLRVCNKAGVPLELVKDPSSASFVLRHGATGTGSLTLPAGHDRVAHLMADGARYHLVSTITGQTLSTGTIRGDQGQAHPGVGSNAQVGTGTWTLVDDHAVLADWNVAPPSGAAYRVLTGPAETVAKTLIGEAATRLGVPHVVEVTQGRGATVKVSARWQPLSDVLYPAVTLAGVGIRVRWDRVNARYSVTAYQPTTWPKTVTAWSGVVDDWQWSRSYPAATRVVVLGPGEGVARLRRDRVDTALEAALGAVREQVVDARDIPDVDPDAVPVRTLAHVHADMDARGDEKLAEAVRTSGLLVNLAAIPEFGFGRPGGMAVGDVLQTQLVPGRPTLLVPVSAVQLAWGVDTGFTVQPVAGEWVDSPLRTLARRVSELATAQRQQRGR